MDADDDEVRITLRLPNKIRNRLKAAADLNGRSMNAEIVIRLSDSIAMSGAEAYAADIVNAVRDIVTAKHLSDSIPRNILNGFIGYMNDNGFSNRDAALANILSVFLFERHYLSDADFEETSEKNSET
ncbi:Arc family DNA-binding protein [Acuticoccus sediminis]|uniref:Arc family DNA-binding protein n=1 Tax=Acuticoccus sediminis TaxID=2184697 RepID=UPI0013908339|nr:Arc family DNA-binding protein [Acuticoccus sediminis]